MNIFELETTTKAKLLDVAVLSDKDRAPDTDPGTALNFVMTVGNDHLAMFDGFLLDALYTAVERKESAQPQQQGLDGVPRINGIDITSNKPKLTGLGMKLKEFKWELETTGNTLLIDHGLSGPKSNIEIADVKLSDFKIFPAEGGSVTIKFKAEAPNISEKMHGQLACLKTREVTITLTPPVVSGGSDDEDMSNPLPFDADVKPSGTAKTVEQAFAEAVLTS